MAVRPKLFLSKQRAAVNRRGRAAYYDRRWQQVRAERVRLNPLCQWCEDRGYTQPTEIVDHVVPTHVAPDRVLDITNTQSLCRRCHAIKTRQDIARWGSATAEGAR